MEKPITYKNRYGDIYTFEKMEDGNILMCGEFKWLRFGWGNLYNDAYNQYLLDNAHSSSLMTFIQFKDAVHEYDDETGQYLYLDYLKLVVSDKSLVTMIDPSGGPYMCEGMDLETVSKKFKGMKIKGFKPREGNYIILIH
jgi:hypothetical protein